MFSFAWDLLRLAGEVWASSSSDVTTNCVIRFCLIDAVDFLKIDLAMIPTPTRLRMDIEKRTILKIS